MTMAPLSSSHHDHWVLIPIVAEPVHTGGKGDFALLHLVASEGAPLQTQLF